ncbi:MAG: serine hydrolase [Desulfobacterales bacterium]
MMMPVDSLMKRATAEKVFPGAVLLVSKNDTILFFEAYGTTNLSEPAATTCHTLFDLASLTKPLATTLAIMKLIHGEKLQLGDPLGSVLPSFKGTEKERITIRHLLCHNSGLPDYRPYYLELGKLSPEERQDALRTSLVKEPLENPVGKVALYSDLGFMVLRWVVETISGRSLDRIVTEDIYHPLGLSTLGFADPGAPHFQNNVAATERCPWRNTLMQGQVHDENAWAVGGVEGHAGLFGTAADVNRLLWRLLAVYHGTSDPVLFDSALVQHFFTQQADSDRALGFDTPSPPHASCGDHYSAHSIGHLGFTGTSFWVDLDRSVAIILLTNRVHPSRDNIRIRAFRPELHNTIMETIGF